MIISLTFELKKDNVYFTVSVMYIVERGKEAVLLTCLDARRSVLYMTGLLPKSFCCVIAVEGTMLVEKQRKRRVDYFIVAASQSQTGSEQEGSVDNNFV
jgi:hypothetical protein